MRREKVEAEVEFKPKGLNKMRAQWLDFGGELVEPIALLAAGASKVEAAWAGLRGVFLTQVLGPIGMVAGAAGALLLTTKKLVGEWKELGMRAAASLERMELQLKPLLGSMELAKQRVKELFDFTAKTPFRLNEVVQSNKMLESLTRGALSTADGMRMVGDAAAVAGTGLQETTRYVGRLYDGLMSGRPVGEATMRLQEMGLISGQTRNQIESMQEANAAGIEIWRVVEKELKRNEGAMNDLSQSLEGLESNYEDTRDQLQAGFSKGFMDGEKAALKATTQAMEKITPVARYFGDIFGWVSSKVAEGRAALANAITGWEGFTGAVKAAAGGLLMLSSAVIAATGAALAKFVIGALSASAASAQLAKSTGSVAAAEAAETAVSHRLAVAKGQLAAAKAAVARGSMMEAAGSVKVAAVQTVAATRTNTLAASHMLLRGTFKSVGAAIRFVIVQLKAMVIAMSTQPIFMVAAAITALAGWLVHLAVVTERARKEIEGYRKATEDLTKSMQEQLATVRTVTDLRKLEAQNIRELAKAYRELEAAEAAGNKDKGSAARDRIEALESDKRDIRSVDPRALERDETEMELRQFLREREVEKDRLRDESEATGPEEKAKLAEERYSKALARRRRAGQDRAAERRVEAEQRRIRREIDDGKVQEGVLKDRRAEVRGELTKRTRSGVGLDEALAEGGVGGFDVMGEQYADRNGERERVKGLIDELKELDEQLHRVRTSGQEELLRAGLGSDSEIQQLQTKVRLYDDLEKAQKEVTDAREALRQAEGAEEPDEKKVRDARAVLASAERQRATLDELSEKHGFGTPRERQDAKARIRTLEKRRKEDLDPKKVEERRQDFLKAEYAVARARVDAEAQVASLRLRGYEAEEKALDFERRKLELAKEKEQIGAGDYRRGREELTARREAMQRQAREQGTRMQLGFEEKRLRRLAEDARREGDPERARALRGEADERWERRRRQELAAEAREVTGDPTSQANFVKTRLAEERAARAGERRERRRERELDREGERADVNQREAGLRARRLRLRGETGRAREVEEEAARRQDEVRRKELRRRLIGQGFEGGEADELAGRQVRMDRANRLIERMGRGGTRVVADSLARIGGGGRVSGRDRDTELLERIEKLLQNIEGNTGGDVDLRME